MVYDFVSRSHSVRQGPGILEWILEYCGVEGGIGRRSGTWLVQMRLRKRLWPTGREQVLHCAARAKSHGARSPAVL